MHPLDKLLQLVYVKLKRRKKKTKKLCLLSHQLDHKVQCSCVCPSELASRRDCENVCASVLWAFPVLMQSSWRTERERRGSGGDMGGDGVTWTIRAGSFPTSGSVTEDGVSRPRTRPATWPLEQWEGDSPHKWMGWMGATIKQSDYFFKESVDWVKGGLFFFVFLFFLALLFHVVKLRRGRKWSWERHTAAVTSSLSLILASVFWVLLLSVYLLQGCYFFFSTNEQLRHKPVQHKPSDLFPLFARRIGRYFPALRGKNELNSDKMFEH